MHMHVSKQIDEYENKTLISQKQLLFMSKFKRSDLTLTKKFDYSIVSDR